MRAVCVALAALLAASLIAAEAAAQGVVTDRPETTQQQALVDRAKTTVEHLKADPNFSNFNELLHQAKGVIIVPELIKAGLIIGGAGGSGLLLVRDAKGEWSDPAFYNVAAASIGFQIGAQVSEVVLVVMNQPAVEKLMTDHVTLGADVSVAAGPMGGSLQAGTTTNVGADIYTFASSKGLFGGLALEGGILTPDDGANRVYYGNNPTARDIVNDRRFRNPGADPLREALPPAWPLPLPTATDRP